jgi:hypothetical protein
MVTIGDALTNGTSPSPLEGEGREGGGSGLDLTCLNRDAAPTPLLPEALRASGILPLKGGGDFLPAQPECRR